MKSLIIVPLVALSALSPVDAAPRFKYFRNSKCTGDPSYTNVRSADGVLSPEVYPPVGVCKDDASAGTSQKLAIEEDVTMAYIEVRQDAAGNPRGNCDGAANATNYIACGGCQYKEDKYETITCDVAAGTVVTKKGCNADCSVCATQDTLFGSIGDCFAGYLTLVSWGTGSAWDSSRYSATGCEASNITGTTYAVCNSCAALSAKHAQLWDCETAGPVFLAPPSTMASGSSSAASSTQFAVGLLFALLVLLLTAF